MHSPGPGIVPQDVRPGEPESCPTRSSLRQVPYLVSFNGWPSSRHSTGAATTVAQSRFSVERGIAFK